MQKITLNIILLFLIISSMLWLYASLKYPISKEKECLRYGNKIQSYLPAKCLKYFKK